MWRLALGVRGLVVCVALLLGATSIAAHHSFDAEFDRNKPVIVTGVVTRVDWFNPHAHVFVDVTDESGKIVNWDFELAGPNGLMRRGWRRDSLKPGDTVTVAGYMAKNAPHVGNASAITTKDGRKMFAAAACFTCHRFANEGGMTGPDLTSAGGRYSPRDLIDQILAPSKEINEQFVPVIIRRKKGTPITGVIVNLKGDSVIVNADPADPNDLVNVDRKDVKSMEPSRAIADAGGAAGNDDEGRGPRPGGVHALGRRPEARGVHEVKHGVGDCKRRRPSSPSAAVSTHTSTSLPRGPN
jgi:putative heme-binding domain-containing protein